MRKYIAEFIGTFFLVFIGTSAITVNQITNGAITHLGIVIAFGIAVMTIIYVIGDVSGAHINPAVTIAFYISGCFERKEVIPYIISQIFGAILGSLLNFYLIANKAKIDIGVTKPRYSEFNSFLLEIILTCFLMMVIMCVASEAKARGLIAGIAIGSAVAMLAIFGGPISGASMNPARSLGPAIVCRELSSIWVYIFGPIIGATIGVYFYKWLDINAYKKVY